MQFKAVAFALAASSVALAQDLSGLPKCAQTPAISSIGSSGCQLTDIKCICSNQSFLSGLQSQVATACPNPADQAAAAAFAAKLCGSVGVTLAVPGPSSAAPASNTVVPATTTVLTTFSVSTPATTPIGTAVGTASGVPVPSGNGTIVAPSAPTSSIVTGGASVHNAGAGVALLMGILGAVVAL